MLLQSTIKEVMGEVSGPLIELIEHGANVVLDLLATANKPFTPSAPPTLRIPADAMKQDASTCPPSTSPPPPPPSSESSSFRASEPSSGGGTAPRSPHSQSPSSSSPSSAYQPDVVALDWWAGGTYGAAPVFRHLEVSGLSRRDFTFLYTYGNMHVAKKTEDSGEGARPSPSAVDVVFWHRSDRVLELQADTGFTKAGVVNAFAREIALNSARTKLLEYAGRTISMEKFPRMFEGYCPGKAADDPTVVAFVARFKANLAALIQEASSAPAAFSISYPGTTRGVKDQLREQTALNHRDHSDRDQYQQALTEYEAAIQAHKAAAAAGSPASSPAPGGETMPEQPKRPSRDDTLSPKALAASPPLVLRPMEDLYRVFTDAEIMVVFRKVVLSRDDCVLCPGYDLWFEEKRTVKSDGGAVRHEYREEAGDPYC